MVSSSRAGVHSCSVDGLDLVWAEDPVFTMVVEYYSDNGHLDVATLAKQRTRLEKALKGLKVLREARLRDVRDGSDFLV